MTKKRRLEVFVLLFAVCLGGFIFINSANLANLEKDIIVKSDIKVEEVGQYTFGKGGLILVGQDKNGDGILRAYTKFPIINRYAKTKAFSYSKADQPLQLAGESWAGYQALTFEESKLTVESDASGIGFVRTLLRWFALSNLGALIITIILNRFFRQEGKPWWKK